MRGWIASAVLLPWVLPAQQQLVLHDGAPVRLRLNRDISSAAAKVGDTAELEVLDDVKAGDTVVIVRGGTARARIVEAQSGKKAGNRGRIEVYIDSVQLVNQDKAALRAVKDPKGGSLFAPFTHGKEFTISRGAEITAYVHGDVTIDPSKLPVPSDSGSAAGPEAQTAESSASGAAPPALPKPMNNEDVVAMREAGISDDLVILKVKVSPGSYHTSAGDIIALKQANVSDPVIQAMLAAAAAATPSAPAAEPPAPAAAEAPRQGLLKRLKVAILGSPDTWSNKPAAHLALAPEPAIPPQFALCPVTILSQPPDAAILVDGYPAGRTPAVVKLQPGSYKVTIQAQGFPAYTQQIIVEAGQVRSFGVALDSSKSK